MLPSVGKATFSKQKGEFRTRGASSPLQEDKWFPPHTCCGCGCSFSGWERVYRLIYGLACVCARNFITKDTRRRKTDPQKSLFFSVRIKGCSTAPSVQSSGGSTPEAPSSNKHARRGGRRFCSGFFQNTLWFDVRRVRPR